MDTGSYNRREEGVISDQEIDIRNGGITRGAGRGKGRARGGERGKEITRGGGRDTERGRGGEKEELEV